MRPPKDKNSGLHPSDPDYDHDYDFNEEYEDWLDEQEAKDDERRCDR